MDANYRFLLSLGEGRFLIHSGVLNLLLFGVYFPISWPPVPLPLNYGETLSIYATLAGTAIVFGEVGKLYSLPLLLGLLRESF